MADAVTATTNFTGTKRHIVAFTNISDGTGEVAVQKVDISALNGAPSSVRIARVWYSISGMQVELLFDHTTNDVALILNGSGMMDFRDNPIKDPGSAGSTGDLLFTTVNAALNDTYCLVLEVVW